ncbi:unnamed protein product, partial [Mesorhabditis spiculigera]
MIDPCEALMYEAGQWRVGARAHETIAELVEMLEDNRHELPSGAMLMKKISRPKYYLIHADIFKKNKIGEGNFGEVSRELSGPSVESRPLVPSNCEARIARILNPRNIVRFYGVAVQQLPVMMVIELAENGGLQAYCEKNPDVPSDQLMAWCSDAATGMAYLHRNEVLHRDLAARNCLLGQELELKISDFGKMSDGHSIMRQLMLTQRSLKAKRKTTTHLYEETPTIIYRGHYMLKYDGSQLLGTKVGDAAQDADEWRLMTVHEVGFAIKFDTERYLTSILDLVHKFTIEDGTLMYTGPFKNVSVSVNGNLMENVASQRQPNAQMTSSFTVPRPDISIAESRFRIVLIIQGVSVQTGAYIDLMEETLLDRFNKIIITQ